MLFSLAIQIQLPIGGILGQIWLNKKGWIEPEPLSDELTNDLLKATQEESWLDRAIALLATMQLAYYASDPRGLAVDSLEASNLVSRFTKLAVKANECLTDDEMQLRFASAWAIVWLLHFKVSIAEQLPNLMSRLLKVWQESQFENTRYVAAWAINSLDPVPSDSKPFREASPELLAFLLGAENRESNNFNADTEKVAAAVVYFYLGELEKYESLRDLKRSGSLRHLNGIKAMAETLSVPPGQLEEAPPAD